MSASEISRAFLGISTLLIGLVVVYYAFIFEGQLPDHPALRGKNDLALHVAAFLAFSVPLLLLGSWRQKVAGLVVFAALIEFVHAFQADRNADWEDFAASVAGIALGGVIVLLLRGIKSLLVPNKEENIE